MKDIQINLIYCFVIIVVGVTAAKALPKLIRYILTDRKNYMSERKARTIASVLSSVTKYSIYFIVISSVLIKLGVQPTSIFAIFGVFGVAVGLGSQAFFKDIINGFLIVMEDQLGVGDYITIEPRTGIVETIGLRTITLRDLDGSLHIIPNSEIRIVTNKSKDFSRAIIDVQVANTVHVDKVIKILEDEMTIQKEILQSLVSEPKVLGIEKMSGATIEIRIISDCKIGEKQSTERELRRCIKNRLDKEGIS